MGRGGHGRRRRRLKAARVGPPAKEIGPARTAGRPDRSAGLGKAPLEPGSNRRVEVFDHHRNCAAPLGYRRRSSHPPPPIAWADSRSLGPRELRHSQAPRNFGSSGQWKGNRRGAREDKTDVPGADEQTRSPLRPRDGVLKARGSPRASNGFHSREERWAGLCLVNASASARGNARLASAERMRGISDRACSRPWQGGPGTRVPASGSPGRTCRLGGLQEQARRAPLLQHGPWLRGLHAAGS